MEDKLIMKNALHNTMIDEVLAYNVARKASGVSRRATPLPEIKWRKPTKDEADFVRFRGMAGSCQTE